MTGTYHPRGLTDEQQEALMTRVELHRKLLVVERERDQLREENLRYRDKLLEICAECSTCDGTGLITVSVDDREVIHAMDQPIVETIDCDDCADIRGILHA